LEQLLRQSVPLQTAPFCFRERAGRSLSSERPAGLRWLKFQLPRWPIWLKVSVLGPSLGPNLENEEKSSVKSMLVAEGAILVAKIVTEQ
jgi:hypothetical protein